MFGKSTKSAPKKPATAKPKKPVAKASKNLTYSVTCDSNGNIKKIVPSKKK